jgi:hypothetical protein
MSQGLVVDASRQNHATDAKRDEDEGLLARFRPAQIASNSRIIDSVTWR